MMAAVKAVLRIGTRGSPLALAQAYEARDRLARGVGCEPDAIEVVPIRTTGDMIQNRPLSEAGGKGLFTKELDIALADGAIDLAIHSAKDLPTVIPDGIAIAGYLPREDVRDVLISAGRRPLADLPAGALVGSASLRRQAQICRIRPDLRVALLRGNVQTRIGRVENGDFAATLLALAGLRRLGLAHVATEVLSAESFLPAVGQGAIAVTVRTGDTRVADAVATMLDEETGIALGCERAFLTRLDGSCRTPIAGHATVADGHVQFRGQVLSPDGSDSVETAVGGSHADATRLGDEAARDLLGRASAGLLSAFSPIG